VPSLRQLLARHPSLLVIDTCSTRVEASVWRGASGVPESIAALDGEASSALPAVVAKALEEAALPLRSLDAIAFCSGPGSVLGIRLAAASLRAWRALRPDLALYAYPSLPLLATNHPALAIIADARRETWHAVKAGSPATLLRVPSAEVPGLGPIGTPASFRRWSSLPEGTLVAELHYAPAALLAASPDAAFFEPAAEPDAFMHETPAYATWTPQIHRAPAPKSTVA
jgi:tRNA threonylcarbamoyladenosine biosynthesis protein TsaB